MKAKTQIVSLCLVLGLLGVSEQRANAQELENFNYTTTYGGWLARPGLSQEHVRLNFPPPKVLKNLGKPYVAPVDRVFTPGGASPVVLEGETQQREIVTVWTGFNRQSRQRLVGAIDRATGEKLVFSTPVNKLPPAPPAPVDPAANTAKVKVKAPVSYGYPPYSPTLMPGPNYKPRVTRQTMFVKGKTPAFYKQTTVPGGRPIVKRIP